MTLMVSGDSRKKSHLTGGRLWMDVDKARASTALTMTPPKFSAGNGRQEAEAAEEARR